MPSATAPSITVNMKGSCLITTSPATLLVTTLYSMFTDTNAPSLGVSHPSPSRKTFFITPRSPETSSTFSQCSKVMSYCTFVTSAGTKSTPGPLTHGGVQIKLTLPPFFMSCTILSQALCAVPVPTENTFSPSNKTLAGPGSNLFATILHVASAKIPGLSQPSPSVSPAFITDPSPKRSFELIQFSSSISNVRVALGGIRGGEPVSP
mmetsp:Transcript_16803/g.68723  ORF Transcript_16803/g.68723 Transcript_16803/m.68723 type:complete len:207 (+) Transcript_16803:1486-2106(+)